ERTTASGTQWLGQCRPRRNAVARWSRDTARPLAGSINGESSHGITAASTPGQSHTLAKPLQAAARRALPPPQAPRRARGRDQIAWPQPEAAAATRRLRAGAPASAPLAARPLAWPGCLGGYSKALTPRATVGHRPAPRAKQADRRRARQAVFRARKSRKVEHR